MEQILFVALKFHVWINLRYAVPLSVSHSTPRFLAFDPTALRLPRLSLRLPPSRSLSPPLPAVKLKNHLSSLRPPFPLPTRLPPRPFPAPPPSNPPLSHPNIQLLPHHALPPLLPPPMRQGDRRGRGRRGGAGEGGGGREGRGTGWEGSWVVSMSLSGSSSDICRGRLGEWRRGRGAAGGKERVSLILVFECVTTILEAAAL